MNNQQAQKLLGLDGTESVAEITAAYQTKIKIVDEKLASAPTDALKQKLNQMKQALEQAHQLLSVAPKTSTSSLSQTKMADLPGAAPQMGTEVNLQIGQILAERYEIKEQIGAGGMGAVFHAFDQTRNQDVALKVLLPQLAQSQRAKERFLNEARLSSQLSHPNIVNVYDMQHDGDYVFLSMELLDGQDLRHLMESRQVMRQDFSEDEAKELAKQMCEALNYAHKHTVHRDIKPENIWVTEDGDFKLMDFGIARVMSSTQRTQTGMSMGTAYYMAPEQLKGTSKIDGRADIYALGVLLYELLSGDVPAGRFKPLKQLRKDLSKGFANAVDKALETSANDRFSDADTFFEALNGKGSNISLPSVSMGKGGKIAAGIVIVVIALSALIISTDKPILDTLASWMPESSEVVKARQMKVVKLEGEAKTLRKELEEFKKSFKFNLKDSETDLKRAQSNLRLARNSAEKNTLNTEIRNLENLIAKIEKQQNFANQYIIPSNNAELNGNFSMLESFLRDKDYKSALIVLEPLHLELYQRVSSIEYLERSMKAKTDLDYAWNKFNSELINEKVGSDKICDENIFLSENTKYSDLLFKIGFKECVKSKQIFQILKFRLTETVNLLKSGELERQALLSELFLKDLKRFNSYNLSKLKTDNSLNGVWYIHAYTARQAWSVAWRFSRVGSLRGEYNDSYREELYKDEGRLKEHFNSMAKLQSKLNLSVLPIFKGGFFNKSEFDLTLELAKQGDPYWEEVFLQNISRGFRQNSENSYAKEHVNTIRLNRAKLALKSNNLYLAYGYAWLLINIEELTDQQEILKNELMVSYKEKFSSIKKQPNLNNNKIANNLLDYFEWTANTIKFENLSAKQFSMKQEHMEQLAKIFLDKELLLQNKYTRISTEGWSLTSWEKLALSHHFLKIGNLKFMKAVLAKLYFGVCVDNKIINKDYMESYNQQGVKNGKLTEFQQQCNPELANELLLLSDENRNELMFEYYKVVARGVSSWRVDYNYSLPLIQEAEKYALAAQKTGSKSALEFLINLYSYNKKDKPFHNNKFSSKANVFKLKLASAQANNTNYYSQVASSYKNGEGVKKNLSKYIFWQKKYIEIEPKYWKLRNLAEVYLNEKSVQNYNHSFKYYNKALNLIETEKQGSNIFNQLGYLYYSGKGVKTDKKKAQKYFLRAARVDNTTSMDWVISNYAYGRGIPVDNKKAEYWRNKKKQVEADRNKKP